MRKTLCLCQYLYFCTSTTSKASKVSTPICVRALQANAQDVVSVSVFVLLYQESKQSEYLYICVRTVQANELDVAVLSVTEIDVRRAPAIKVNLQVRSQRYLKKKKKIHVLASSAALLQARRLLQKHLHEKQVT